MAAILYSKLPSAGRSAGRLVDGELWAKVSPALAVATVSEDFIANELEDDETKATVRAIDGRRISPPPRLSSDGFELVRSPIGERDWLGDLEASRQVAEDEAVRLVRKATGCSDALAFNVTWRSSAKDNRDSSLGPARYKAWSSAVARVHADFTPESAARKVDELVNAGTATAAFAQPHNRAIINVWRAFGVGPKVEHAPLGFLHPKSIDADSFPYYLVHQQQAGINASIAASPSHHWVYFPHMTPDEALLFYNYDDRPGAIAPGGTFHAALDVPSPDNLDGLPRLSVEVRVLVHW